MKQKIQFLFVIAVLSAFRDKENPDRVFGPGDSLETGDLKRVNDIVGRGLGFLSNVKVVEAPAPAAPAEEAKEAPEKEQEQPAAEAPAAPAEEAKEAPEKEQEQPAAEAPAAPAEEAKEEDVKVVSVLGTEYELAKVKEGLNAIGVKTAANAGVEAVAKKVVELTDEQANALVEKLSE